MSSTNRNRKYLKSLESVPELKDWIAPLSSDESVAYCKVCRRPLHPHKKDLQNHALTKKHIKNMERFKNVLPSTSNEPFSPTKFENSENLYLVDLDGNCETSPLNKGNVTIAVFSNSEDIAHKIESDCSFEDGLPIYDEDMNETTSIIINSEVDLLTLFEEWKNIPEFHGWLSYHRNFLYCAPCKRRFQPNKIDLLRHSCGKIHKQKCNKRGITTGNYLADSQLSLLFSHEQFIKEEVVIDLRSDAVTKPTIEMKNAMITAELGDDSFRDDPTVKDLEGKLCSLLGMEAALLFPSGTMANLAAALIHCSNRDSQVILGDQSHMYTWSQGGMARIGGLLTRPLKNDSDGTFTFKELKGILKNNNFSSPMKNLVCIENPNTKLGGKVLPMKWLEEFYELCQTSDVLVHMDGARLLNASVHSAVSPSTIVKGCHSVTFCLNKGLGAPMGSVLLGSKDFINKAISMRGLLGGNLHQSGLFCAAALYSLENMTQRIYLDHANARKLGKAIDNLNSSAVIVDLRAIQTNIMHLHLDTSRLNSKELCERLSKVSDEESSTFDKDIKIHSLPVSDSILRLVTHYDISDSNIALAIKKILHVIGEYDNQLKINFDSLDFG